MTLTLATILAYAATASLLIMSPGPNGVLIAKTVPGSGARAAFANIAGFAAAFMFHGVMATIGISAIVLQSAELFSALKLAGALYLCWLGYKALREAFAGLRETQDVTPKRRLVSLRAAALEGFVTNALNPKVAMFYLAALPQFVDMQAPGVAVNVAVLVLLHACLNFVWFGTIVLLFSRLKGFGQRPGLVRVLKALTGVVFLGFGARLAMLER